MTDQPNSGRMEGREHVLPVRIYYEDTDFTGAVYHANYLRYFERGRSDFLRLLGVGHVALSEVDTAFAVTRMEVEFHRAARIDDALVIRTGFLAARGPRMTIGQRILRDDHIIASATVQVACIDSSGRAKRPPPGLVKALAPLLAP